MALPITERQASEMSGTDLFYTVVRRADDEYGDPYYVRLASLMSFILGFDTGGYVLGPVAATDNAVARFHQDSQHIQNSSVIITDAGAVSGVTTLGMGGALSGATSGTFSEAVTMDDLYLNDIDSSHTLLFHWNENEAAANRILNFVMGGSTRTVTFSGNPTLADWFDQSVKATAIHGMKGLLASVETELTIAGGAITATQMRHKVDTQNNDPSDDLDTINGGATVNMIVIRAENGARTIVVKHNAGNIWLQGGSDVSLDDVGDGLLLVWDSTNSIWFDISAGGAPGSVTSAVVIVDHTLVRGDGGARGVQDSGWVLSDGDVLTAGDNLDMNDKDVVNLRDIFPYDSTLNVDFASVVNGTVYIKNSGSAPEFGDSDIDNKSGYLVAYWRMEETGAANRVDDVNAHDLVPTNTPGTRAGINNNACDFIAGSTQYLSVANHADLSPTTGLAISWWAWVDDTGSYRTFVTKAGPAGPSYWATRTNTGDTWFTIWQSDVTGKVAIHADQLTGAWHHLVGMACDGFVRLYIDGSEVATPVAYDNTINAQNTSFYVGYDTTPNYMDGGIDEVAFWKNITFTNQTEREAFVTALYNAGSGRFYSAIPGEASLDVQDFLHLSNTGLQMADTDDSHNLNIKWNENEAAADRTLNIVMGGADRTITLGGNLTVEASSIINSDLSTDANWATSGSMQAGADADVASIFGRAQVGFIAGLADIASFAHVDQATATAYAFRQDANADTYINTETGQKIYFAVHDVVRASMSSSVFTLADGMSFALEEQLRWIGGTAVNTVKFPDNLADALSYENANGDIFQKFISTTGSLGVEFGQNVGIGTTPAAGHELDVLTVYTAGDAYGVYSQAITNNANDNIGVYANAVNAGAGSGYPFLDNYGNYSSTDRWEDVSDPARKTLIRDVEINEKGDLYDQLNLFHIKRYRVKADAIIDYEKDEFEKIILGTSEWGEENVPLPIYGNFEDAPERMGLLANDPDLPDWFISTSRKGIAPGRIATFNLLCNQMQKQKIEDLEARIIELESN